MKVLSLTLLLTVLGDPGDRGAGELRVLACHFETERPSSVEREASRSALARYSQSVNLRPTGPSLS